MLKFNRAAGNQGLGTPDSTKTTLPIVRTIGIVMRIDGTIDGDNPQYLWSTGNFQTAGSFNMFYNTSGTSAALASRVVVVANTLDAAAPLLLSAPLTSGTHLFLVDCDGVTATFRHCPIVTALPGSTSTIVRAGSTTDANHVRELNGTGFMFGTRLDGATNRKCDQSLGPAFVVHRTITDAEMLRLASGEELTDLGYTPAFHSRMRSTSAADYADRSPNALPMTLYGSPTTSAEPAYAYVPTQPVANTVTVDESYNNRVFQSGGSSAPVVLSGSYTGVAPTGIDARLAPDGAGVAAFQALGSVTIGNGVWSGTIVAPDGGPYAYEAQSKSGTTVLATSSRSSAKFLVGDLVLLMGSSSASRLLDADSGTGYTVSAVTRKLVGTSWSVMTSTGAATQMAADLAAKAGKPIGILGCGVSGTNILNWLNTSGTQWQAMLATLAAAGGKIKIAYFTLGSNDAGNGTITSAASHQSNMEKVVDNVRAATAQLSLPGIWSGSNRRPPLNAVQADRLRTAENGIGDYPNVLHVQTLDFELNSDDVHLSAGPLGYAASVKRATTLGGRFVYDGVDPKTLRGPLPVGAVFRDNQVWVDVAHRAGSDLTPATGATGFAVTDASGSVPITAVARFSSTREQITVSRALVAPVTVSYGAGAAPTMTAPVYSDYSPPLPMVVNTSMVAVAETVADTTAPTFTGTIEVSNITSSSATLTGPVASDAVGVAGYQISTNGGSSFANTASNVVALTGLPAATTINAQMRAYDAAGNYSDPLSRSFTTLAAQDTTAPAFPSGAAVSITSITNNGATLTVPAATDAVGVAGYQVSVNGGVSYNNAPGRVIPLTGLPAGTAVAARVRAYDAAMNYSAALPANFTTLANTTTPEAPAFMRSLSRTINIKAAPLTFEGGPYWTLANPRRPVGSIDPNATIDITFNWTEVLVDIQDTIADVQFDIIGVTNKGAFRDGAFATIFVANATGAPSITCRITTASAPPRIEDRTVYLTVEQQ